jgi:hypothetical protein
MAEFDMSAALIDWSPEDQAAFKAARKRIREALRRLDRKPLDPATVGSAAHALLVEGARLRDIGEARHMAALRAKDAFEANPFVEVNRIGEELLKAAVSRYLPAKGDA